MADIKEFAKHLIGLSNPEINKLLKVLKDEYGIEPKKTETHQTSSKQNKKIAKRQTKISSS